MSPVANCQAAVTYLQFPIQVCFACSDHVQPATHANFCHSHIPKLIYGVNSSIDIIFTIMHCELFSHSPCIFILCTTTSHYIRLTAFSSRTTWVSQHQKANHSGFYWSKRWWGDSGISWTIRKSFAPRSRQITTPVPHHCVMCCILPTTY